MRVEELCDKHVGLFVPLYVAHSAVFIFICIHAYFDPSVHLYIYIYE